MKLMGFPLGNQYARGLKHTLEWKKEQSLRLLGNEHGFRKGKPSPRKGKKSQFPAWNKGLKMPEKAAERHPNWKGGKSRDIHSLYNPKYREWRTKVFTRDNFSCKTPDSSCEEGLQAHHIFRWADYPKLRYQLENGITLCKFHHPRKKAEEQRLADYFLSLIDSNVSHLSLEERDIKSPI